MRTLRIAVVCVTLAFAACNRTEPPAQRTFDTPEEAQDARRQFLEDPEKYEKPPDPRPSPWGTGVRQVNTGRFEANVSRKGRWHYLGMFATAAEAREARRKFLENNP